MSPCWRCGRIDHAAWCSKPDGCLHCGWNPHRWWCYYQEEEIVSQNERVSWLRRTVKLPLGSWREFLPAHWQFAWADALQPQLEWGGMIKGAAVSVSYALVLFALAFRGFSRKDITS